ncbi:hypothetical protein L2E82_30500 [Cichorium intybus]|uniref:Uncharacterized protein n=1 Tax=Cichorium intybus TaxID=13427 RepID=A0ACB9D193_CICIN|nr:hypothetical protein L2E82_30500 [Cichorium intybus]
MVQTSYKADEHQDEAEDEAEHGNYPDERETHATKLMNTITYNTSNIREGGEAAFHGDRDAYAPTIS